MGRTRSTIAYLAVAVAAALLVADVLAGMWTFFGENRGIDFYRQRPQLIGACLVVAIAAGLLY